MEAIREGGFLFGAGMYESLEKVLEDALLRASVGKGRERHGDETTPFTEQPIFTIPKTLGSDESPMLFQALKKIYESRRMEDTGARYDELLDAIVYLAAACIYIETRGLSNARNHDPQSPANSV